MDSAFKALEREKVLSHASPKERIRRLIIRMNYIRQGSLQFSGAQVAAMLLKIGKDGTHYTESSFMRINLYTFINYVEWEIRDYYVPLTSRDIDDDPFLQREEVEHPNIGDEEEVDLDLVNCLIPVAVEDYVFRGDRLSNYSLYETYRDTKCVSMSHSEKEKYLRSIEERAKHRGQPYNERIVFQTPHSRHLSRWTIVRSRPSVPYIVRISFKQKINF
jgi:hypothetical protein